MTQKLNFDDPNAPCFIIAEVGQTHDGSLGVAHAFIDAIANAGADAVKFQTHIASAESTPDEPWRIKFSPQDVTRYDYWKRMEFTEEHWHGLKKHAEEKNLQFISTPFSFEAVDLLKRVGVSLWKVGSGETNNTPMLEQMADTGLPIILSTGMSTIGEIDDSVELIKSREVPLAVLQCTTAYPCPPEKVGLNMIPFYRERYQCAVGLSDHSGSIFTGLAAATLGVNVLEVHVTLSHEMFGPDVPASISTEELRKLVEGIRYIETMMSSPVDKGQMAEDLSEIRQMFTKSVVVRDDLREGTVLEARHLTVKKPGTGIPASRLMDVIGRRLVRAVTSDAQISEEDLE